MARFSLDALVNLAAALGRKVRVELNGSGEYLVCSLPVGDYILTVAAANFETGVVTDIHVYQGATYAASHNYGQTGKI